MISAPDSVATEAVDAARAALVEQVGADVVGDHLSARPESEGAVTHNFACTQAGYPGWVWAVTVAHAAGPGRRHDRRDRAAARRRGDHRSRVGARGATASSPATCHPVTCCPPTRTTRGWSRRTSSASVPTTTRSRVVDELGLGRARVLSLEGRDLAAQRWYDGDQGPDVPLAQSAPGRCGGCGFLVRLDGPLATMFGVCANEYANDDGRVVALNHGCGAHSEAQLRKKQLPPPMPDHVFDTVSRDDLEEF